MNNSLKMSLAEREAFLADIHVGVVSIGREDKAPLTVPIWYDYALGGKVWMITGASSLKAAVLASTDQISLVAQTEAPPYKYVSVSGKYTTRDVAEGELEAMAIRYLGEDQGHAYAKAASTGNDFVVEFEPTSWLTVDYSKM